MASDVSPKEIARAGVLVLIPPALRSYTDGQDEVVLEASNVATMLHALDANSSPESGIASSTRRAGAGRT